MQVADGREDDPERPQDRTQRGDEQGVLNAGNARQRAPNEDAEGMSHGVTAPKR